MTNVTPESFPLDELSIGPIRRGQLREVVRVIAASLMEEPTLVMIVPDRERRLRALTSMLTSALRDCARQDTVTLASHRGRVAGVAIWQAPGAYPVSFWRQIRMLPATFGIMRLGARAAHALAEIETNARQYFPDHPVWYLQAAGVDPRLQGKGIGTRLLQPVLERADRNGFDCYLETGTERNVRFYERLGFEVVESAVQLASSGPTHWTMLRHPKPDWTTA